GLSSFCPAKNRSDLTSRTQLETVLLCRKKYGRARQIIMHRRVYPVPEEHLHETAPGSVSGTSRCCPDGGRVRHARRRSNLGHCGCDQNSAEAAAHPFSDTRQSWTSNALLPEMDSG